MNHYAPGESTKLSIILAAGELFAEQGRDATTVREIVAKANTTLSSVSYYFGSKDNLYLEAVRYVIRDRINLHEIFSIFEEKKPRGAEEISECITIVVRNLIFGFLSPGEAEWLGRLAFRSTYETSAEEQEMLNEAARIHLIADIMVRNIKGLSLENSYFWISSLFGQVQWFITGKFSVQKTFGLKKYNENFLEKVVRKVSDNLTYMLMKDT